MKRVLIFLLVMKFSLLFAQNYNDKIITLKGDTIHCEITLVNSENIFYTMVFKKDIRNEYMPLTQIKNWIIDKNSKALLLQKAQFDSIAHQGKTDTLLHRNVLIAKRTKVKNGQEQTAKVSFELGQKVYLETISDTFHAKGRIKAISDSFIMVNAERIAINDIGKISKHRGGDVLVMGVSAIAVTGILLSLKNRFFPLKYDEDGDDVNGYDNMTYTLVLVAVIFVEVICFLPAGIIKLAATRHYKAKRGWKFEVVK